MEEDLKLIGRRIKILRMEHKMGQTEMAKKMGLSQTNLSNMENGRTAVTIQNLLKLRKILNCSMSDFFLDLEAPVEKKREEVKGKSAIELEDAVQILRLLKAVNVKGL